MPPTLGAVSSVAATGTFTSIAGVAIAVEKVAIASKPAGAAYTCSSRVVHAGANSPARATVILVTRSVYARAVTTSICA